MGRKSKVEKLEGVVLDTLKTCTGLTTQEIALELGISWNTADKILKILQSRSSISCTRYGRVNVWGGETTHHIVKSALEEDIGPFDMTSTYTIPRRMRAKAVIRAKERCVVCGLDVAKSVFLLLDKKTKFKELARDGDMVKRNQKLAEVTGSARSLLAGERTALNFMQRLSGIATKTNGLAKKIKNCDVKLLDTRKTTPGLRMLEKYAVKCGGGDNHRFGLYDGVLVKDNHIRLAGLENSIKNAKKSGKKVEVEAGSLKDVDMALKAGADIIMLDNMSIKEMKEAVKIIGKGAIIEVSGGITERNILSVARLGIDWISVGGLTHSVKAVDIGMDMIKRL